VPEGSTLFEAVLALEKAQEEFDHTKYKHRGVLILNKDQQVIGKLGQLDVLRAFEPKDENPAEINDLRKFGFSTNFVHKLRKQRRMSAAPLRDLCSKASKLRVEDFMQTPSEGEFIEHEASLEMAVMQLVSGHHISLLVTRDKEIIGILRMTDVFAAIFHTMKECEINI
jgi:CBS-domain-containing membrane protein